MAKKNQGGAAVADPPKRKMLPPGDAPPAVTPAAAISETTLVSGLDLPEQLINDLVRADILTAGDLVKALDESAKSIDFLSPDEGDMCHCAVESLMKPKQQEPKGDEVVSLALDAIAPSKFNPRKTMKGMEELADSIRRKGVLSPILVRPLPRTGQGIPLGKKDKPAPAYELVYGERRWRASQMAGRDTIPAIVRDYSDKDVLEIQVVENDQRQDPDPLDQAHGYRRMMDEAGYTVTSLAEKIGRSESYVYARLQLTKLTKKWQDMLGAGDIQLAHGELVARLPEKDQDELHQDLFRYRREDQAISVTDLRRSIENSYIRDVTKAVWLKHEKEYGSFLSGASGCVQCPKRSGFQSNLFPDINAKRDICLDRGCFDKKQQAYVQLQVTRLANNGEKPVQVSMNWSSPAKGVLKHGDFEIVSKKDAKTAKGVVPAVVYDGNEVGSIVYVKVHEKLKANASRSATPDYAEQNRKQREKEELHRKIGRAAVIQALDTVAGPTPAELEQRALLQIMEYTRGEHWKYFASRLGIKWGDSGVKQQAAFLAIIKKIQATPHLRHQLYILLLVDHVFDSWSDVNLKDLGQLLAPYDVDMAKITEQIKAQRALKQPEKKAKKGAKR